MTWLTEINNMKRMSTSPEIKSTVRQRNKEFSVHIQGEPNVSQKKSIESLSKANIIGIKGSEGEYVPEHKQGISYPPSMTGKGLYLRLTGPGSYVPTDEHLTFHVAGTVVCDGKGGFETRINQQGDDHCGVRKCTVEHEELHIKQFSTHEPNICKHPHGILGAVVSASDTETLKFYERPAYELSVSCLEDRKKEFPLLDRVFRTGCTEEVNQLIETKKTKYHQLTGETL